MNRFFFFLLLAILTWPSTGAAHPRRLVIALDGIAYRDMKALQAGIPYTNIWGGVHVRRAFTADEGYYPVSRMISTFPSTSDVAWTDIFGNRPLPGYQRTYYSVAANAMVAQNGVTTTVEHERQMDWQAESTFVRSMGYIYSFHTYEYEVRKMIESFWDTRNTNTDFYAYIRASDDAQHLDRNVFSMLCVLDDQLQNLRARYKAREGRDLQILIMSDHGHNHAGPGQRVKAGAFLEKLGYNITQSIVHSNDVVLPTAGIEDWVEIHNAPSVTETLALQLTNLDGADIIAARLPDRTNRFFVLNFKGERAMIDWNPAKNIYRYSTENGDPLEYRPVIEKLKREKLLDAGGFASADAWAKATMTNRYPLALERITRGLTSITLNPATILVSLNNQYVHAGWLVKESARLERYGSTHGALDDINSDGIVLSNFRPTHDTSTERVAEQFDDFPGLRQYRDDESNAEWVTKNEQARTRIARDPFDSDWRRLPPDDVFLRVWSPKLDGFDVHSPITIVLKRVPRYPNAQIKRGVHKIAPVSGPQLTFRKPVSVPNEYDCERVYALPPDVILKPLTQYQISGWSGDSDKGDFLFQFDFYTNKRGRPAAF